MSENSVYGLTWEFLRDMGRWALALAALVSAVALLGYRDVSFAVGCLAATTADVALMGVAVRAGQRELEQGSIGSFVPGVMIFGRLSIKVILLGLAVVIPSILSLAGTAVGALAYNLTLAFVGSVRAASGMMVWQRKGSE